MSKFGRTNPGLGARLVVPPPPRLPELPAEEMTPVNTSAKPAPDSGVTVGSGSKKVHVGTATIVAVIAAVAAGYGGRATAASGGAVDAEEFREFKREVREDLRAIRSDVRAIRRDRSPSQAD